LAGFLSFDFARITSQVTGSFQRYAKLRVHFFQGPGEAVPDGSCLSHSASAGNIDRNVHAVRLLDGSQRGADGFSLLLGFAIFGYVATIDHEVAGSFLDSNPGRTGFSAARSNEFC
jgi:hypothetical protein